MRGLWPFLIRHRLVARFLRPLVEHTRRCHLVFRRRLEATSPSGPVRAPTAVSAGV